MPDVLVVLPNNFQARRTHIEVFLEVLSQPDENLLTKINM